MLYLVRLLDLDADPHAVYARLDQDSLVLVAGDGQRVQQHFGRRLGFDLGDIVTLRGLRCEVREAQRGGQGGAHALQVGAQ